MSSKTLGTALPLLSDGVRCAPDRIATPVVSRAGGGHLDRPELDRVPGDDALRELEPTAGEEALRARGCDQARPALDRAQRVEVEMVRVQV